MSRLLREAVVDELEFEPSIDTARIGVTVGDDGVVTLSGHVGTYIQKVAALGAARRVKGVHAVADEIAISQDGPAASDEDVARRALLILQWDSMVPADAVKLTVREGWVTLTGEVSWQFQRDAAEEAMGRLSGVRGITNGIVLKPAAQVANVNAQIESALKRRAETEARAITVTVRDGVVTLTGDVETWAERQAVRSAAWAAAGVRTVEDHLRVVPGAHRLRPGRRATATRDIGVEDRDFRGR